jgi:hypothetical protein
MALLPARARQGRERLALHAPTGAETPYGRLARAGALQARQHGPDEGGLQGEPTGPGPLSPRRQGMIIANVDMLRWADSELIAGVLAGLLQTKTKASVLSAHRPVDRRHGCATRRT